MSASFEPVENYVRVPRYLLAAARAGAARHFATQPGQLHAPAPHADSTPELKLQSSAAAAQRGVRILDLD